MRRPGYLNGVETIKAQKPKMPRRNLGDQLLTESLQSMTDRLLEKALIANAAKLKGKP